ncbi:GTP-binding protein YihA [Gammaproteobacteria bacterium]
MNPTYRRACFLTGAHQFAQLPSDEGSEVAFAGRSNVGKSSAINAITGIGRLARTSRTPGRTQQINFFTLDEGHRLVDLPGYGYAEVPPALQRHWKAVLERYLRERRSLRGVVVVMDARHPLKDLDQGMLDWCATIPLPVHILLTKADKLNQAGAQSALRTVTAALLDTGQEKGTVQLFSATRGQGLEEVCARLDSWLGW